MKIFKIIFTTIGFLMICGAILMTLNTYKFLDEAALGTGEVTGLVESHSDNSVTYSPVVEFQTLEGNTLVFESSFSSSPPAYDIGEKVEVYYLPSLPDSAKLNGFFSLWGGGLILGIIGSVFFTIGAGIILYGILQNRKALYLKEHGIPVQSAYKGVEINTRLEVNGRNPYIIVSEWLNKETGKLHIFKSKNLWFDPSDHITSSDITVYINKNKPGKYHLDTSFLPEVV